MIKSIAINTIVFGLILSAFGNVQFGYEMTLSVWLGCLIMVLNLLGLAFLWKVIFSKKSIALAVMIIIFKYLFLGLILWNLSQIDWLKPIGFVLGLSSLLLGILSGVVLKKYFDKENQNTENEIKN